MPGEDFAATAVFGFFNDPTRDWALWMICDGHAGPKTAQLVQQILPPATARSLAANECVDRAYRPNDAHIARTIRNVLLDLDRELLQRAAESVRTTNGDLASSISALSPVMSGTCMLMAIFDPARSVLRVANVGDSRAVLGRWDAGADRYVAQSMSHDHTGFNESEVQRLKRDHPGEEPVDSQTGRVHGMAVSRAIGDARWKWTQEFSQLVHDKFWGPRPRPDGLIRTPPYLTAEPEILETRVQFGERPDFLIMASDGLWDLMSSEDAVICVEQWLQTYRPDDVAKAKPPFANGAEFERRCKEEAEELKTAILQPMAADEETYFDDTEKVMKWRVSPKHFIVEDANCGAHLSRRPSPTVSRFC